MSDAQTTVRSTWTPSPDGVALNATRSPALTSTCTDWQALSRVSIGAGPSWPLAAASPT